MKKFLGFICLVYAGIIGYIWIFDQLKNFLAPTMQIYIKASLIPLIIIGIILYFNEHIHYKFKITDLVLILPLIMFIFASDGRLSTTFAEGRMNFNNISNKANKVKKVKVIENNIDTDIDTDTNANTYDFTNPDFEIIDENYYELANYLTFLVEPSKYIGKTVRVKGFAAKVNKYVSGNYIGIGKYGITCCAADAGFVGFLAQLGNHKVKLNKWYEVEGVLEKTKDNAGYDILVLKIINIKEIDGKNEEQYVYSCYTYGDGSCSEVDKYNLEMKE